MRRRPSLELLDTDSGTQAEVEASIRDLRWFNRWFGGIRTSRILVHTVAKKTRRSDFTLLEVAAGEGFLPNVLRQQFEFSRIRLRITLLDRIPSHLPVNGSKEMAPMSRIAADALHLPFADEAFDLVSCSLFVHHLSAEQVVAFGVEALRVCRTAVLVHDLIRNPLHLVLAYAGVPLYRSRITRNDAPASVRQAYTVAEMRSFFQQAGASEVDAQSHYLFRMGVIAWKTKGLANA
jgi:ubiquinone/menaquinone biosynthesis C-methylase UbiE